MFFLPKINSKKGQKIAPNSMWMCFGVAKTAGYVYFGALSADGFHSLHGLQFADEQPQLQVVLDEDG